ncbi:hypothetical protein AYL99_09542 [Fonsecaea erecta]|uniref:Glucose-methanol-choline oxidoreductase N-terminal domain-containing protein n=1 Tax=Fonsecaea erecta TaxID=1367422 RepID=A0A178ZAZ8_9EURO|nr:hypothetical protein AYL99_09542 [Fonsecaea erecta]OAP56363.1 hypothetical protein AYL99_09542 [Fonsecaea erecta]
MDVKTTYDFIVVGGGTAGLVVAGRLAENPKVQVLVVEAGKGDPEKVEEIMTPALAFHLPESEYDWAYETKMVSKPGYERTEAKNTRGKVLGGSSCLNYFTWLKGSSATYDEWVKYGGPSWSFQNCWQYFRKPASFYDEDHLLSFDPPDVGENGPDSLLHVSPTRPIPLAERLFQAWQSRGYSVSGNVWGGNVDGMTHLIRTVHNGVRSTSNCFIRGKRNITVLTSTVAEMIVTKDGAAEGVVVQSPEGKAYYHASQEVIVSCGVFESPKLLMLSGIGPQEELLARGLPCLADSWHVGKNLQDHPILPHVFQVPEDLSMDDVIRPGPRHDKYLQQYRDSKTGPLTSGLLEVSAFARIEERLQTCKEWRTLKDTEGNDPLGPEGQPHLEIDFVPCFAKPFQPHIQPPASGGYLTVIVSLLRPRSRGTVSLRSSKATDKPLIDLNFLAEQVDVVGLREGTRFVDEILQKGDGMREVILGEYPKKMPRDSDEEMGTYIHQRVSTGYRQDIEHGVLDERLRVYGIGRIRVIDASVFPIIPDARIQNAVYMVAEKGADMIKEDHADLFGLSDVGSKPMAKARGIWNAFTTVVTANRELWRQL